MMSVDKGTVEWHLQQAAHLLETVPELPLASAAAAQALVSAAETHVRIARLLRDMEDE